MSDETDRDDSETGEHPETERPHEKEAPESEEGQEDEEDKGPPLYKRPRFWIILILIVIVVGVAGTLWWLHKRQYESTDDAFVDAHIVRLAAQVSGQLTAVAPVDNRHVPAGALLATIEPDAAEATLAQAKAQALSAEAQIQQAEAQVRAAEAKRGQAIAQARQPQAEAAKAAADLKRYIALRRLDPAAVAGTQIDQARAQATSTAAQAAAARQAIRDAEAQIAVAQKQVKAAQAQKASAEAQVQSAGVTFGHLDIRAPISGQVVNRSVNVGSYVSPGAQLMAIVPDRLWITANFKETQLSRMRRGEPVDIKVDAFPDVHFKGRVDSIQHGAGQAFALLPAQNATGNYVKVVQRVPVRILFDTKNGPDPRNYPIGPGMSVTPSVKVR
ncbi:MAG TPA: HlyD family secretion protein [Sphingomonas sp.]|nr:HlyD family secretion protein [Sphingomonas sp.]